MPSGGEGCKSTGSAKQVLPQIFGPFGELSDALSHDGSSHRVGSSNMEANNTVEGAVRKVFGCPRFSGSGSQHDGMISESSTAISPVQPVPPAVPPPLLKNDQNALYNTRRYFGNQRSAMKNNRSKMGS